MQVLVLGAGVIGLVTALALDRLGCKVTLLERQHLPFRPSLRTLALSPQSLALLDSLEVRTPLACHLGNYEQMQVWVHDKPHQKLTFQAYDYGEERLGAVVAVDALLQVLKDAVQERGILVKAGCTSVVLQEYQEQVNLVVGDKTFTADFLVVAEGPKTPLIDFLGLQRRYVASPHQAMTGLLATELPHNNLAYQIFHPMGPFAVLPCAEQHQVSFVYSIDKTLPVSLEQLDFATLTQGLLGSVTPMSTLEVAPIQSHTLERYGCERVWCVGDTVQVVPPIAGLGVNLGFGAVAALLEQVPGLQQGTVSYRGGLRAYEVACYLRLQGMQHAFASLIGMSGLPGLGAILGGVNQVPQLKKMFARQAMG